MWSTPIKIQQIFTQVRTG